jgi:hypothetical protein
MLRYLLLFDNIIMKLEEEQKEEEAPDVKRQCIEPVEPPSNPEPWKSSTFYRLYLNPATSRLETPTDLKTFKRRFHLTYPSFTDLMAQIRRENWFPEETGDAVYLELLVLGSLRYLSRNSCCFDELEDLTGIKLAS